MDAFCLTHVFISCTKWYSWSVQLFLSCNYTYHSKKYLVVFAPNMLLAFLWFFCNFCECKTIYLPLSGCWWLQKSLGWFLVGNSFPQSVSSCDMRNQLFIIITGVFFCASLILLCSCWEGMTRAITRSYSRALNKRFPSSPPWHCPTLQACRSVKWQVEPDYRPQAIYLILLNYQSSQKMPQPWGNADFCPGCRRQLICMQENKNNCPGGSLGRCQGVRPSPVFVRPLQCWI